VDAVRGQEPAERKPVAAVSKGNAKSKPQSVVDMDDGAFNTWLSRVSREDTIAEAIEELEAERQACKRSDAPRCHLMKCRIVAIAKRNG
jgi:hypothetical protein